MAIRLDRLRFKVSGTASRRIAVPAALTLLLGVIVSSVPEIPSAEASPAVMASVSAGGGHTCALTSGGGVECWGSDAGGELGDGITEPNPDPSPVAATGLSSGVTAINAGLYSTCALTSAGGVECWGDELPGAGETPTPVTGLSSGVSAISVGSQFACALTNAGGVECWGDNAYGQLGDGTPYNDSAPQQVTGLSGGVTAIATGDQHACAILHGGSVECWGDDYYGQLGNNTSGPGAFSSVPVSVTGLSAGVTAITGGDSHTCAITSTGGAYCWGYNAEGQLGNGITTNASVPVPVSGLSSGVSSISAGYDHTCALSSAGAAECWGDNTYGELGDGTTTDRSSPVTVKGLPTGLEAITSGDDDTCVLTSIRGVDCWGDNGYDQLGNNTTAYSAVPVTISVEAFDSVTFDSEGGSAEGALVNLDGTTLTLPTPSYPGSSLGFVGWNTAPNGSGIDYPAGALGYTLTASLTLYAQWLPIPSVTMTDNHPSEGQALTVTAMLTGTDSVAPTGAVDWWPPCDSTTGPVLSGDVSTYTCSINDASAGTSIDTAAFEGDANYAKAQGTDHVCVAAAEPDAYSYAANGASGAVPASGSGLDCTTIALAANTLSDPGYSFTGWSDGTATYAAGATYTLSSVGNPIVFTAQWTPNPTDEYSYAANGGHGTVPPSGSGLDGTTITLAANTLSNPGYTFIGWSDGTATYSAGDAYTVSSVGNPIVFTAQWTPNVTDEFSYAANGGHGTVPPSGSGLDGTTITLAANTLSNPGYSFIGWSDGAATYSARANYVLSSQGIPIVFTAQWTENFIDTVAFDSDGGAAVSSLRGPDGSLIALPPDSRSGYIFDGWFTAAKGGPVAGIAGTSYAVPPGGITFFAQWTKKSAQTIAFGTLANTTLAQSLLTVSATASSGLTVTFTTTTPSVCTSGGTNDATITLHTAGGCTVKASQVGDNVYKAATTVSRSFRVSKVSQTITFGPFENKALAQSPVTISATASSGLTVAFSTSTAAVCTSGGVNGATITLIKTGTCTVRANQAGNLTYSATKAEDSFTVG